MGGLGKGHRSERTVEMLETIKKEMLSNTAPQPEEIRWCGRIADLAQLLGISYERARQLCLKLVDDGWLVRAGRNWMIVGNTKDKETSR